MQCNAEEAFPFDLEFHILIWPAEVNSGTKNNRVCSWYVFCRGQLMNSVRLFVYLIDCEFRYQGHLFTISAMFVNSS